MRSGLHCAVLACFLLLSSRGALAASTVVHWGLDVSDASLTVALGDTVTWLLDEDAFSHTVTSQTLVFSSGTLTPGSSFSYTFTTIGAYPYHCAHYPQYMNAVITVAASIPQATGPDTISDVRATPVSPVEVHVAWGSTVANAVFIITLETSSGSQITKSVTGSNSAHVHGLAPDTTYSVTVSTGSSSSGPVYTTTNFASIWSTGLSGYFSDSSNWYAIHPPCSRDFVTASSATPIVIEMDRAVGFQGLVCQQNVVFSVDIGIIVQVLPVDSYSPSDDICVTNICYINNGGCGTNSACSPDGDSKNVCQCNTGYYSPTADNKNCVTNSCYTDNGGCGTNSACTPSGDGVNTCACNTGYYSPAKDNKNCITNGCYTDNGGCAQNCFNVGTTVPRCSCNDGYSRSGSSCNAINNCVFHNGGCEHICNNDGPGKSHCTCNSGYQKHGVSCSAINYCTSKNGRCSHICHYDGPGDYHCTCNAGYTLSGSTCTAINVCAANNGGCAHNCVNDGPGKSHCTCNRGYALTGSSCTAVNNCGTDNGGCGHNCIYDAPGVSHCACNAGYILSGSKCILSLVCSTDSDCTTFGYVCGNSNGDRMTNQCISKCKTNIDCKASSNGCGSDGHCSAFCYNDAQCSAPGYICGNKLGDKNYSKCTTKCATNKGCAVAGKTCNSDGHCM